MNMLHEQQGLRQSHVFFHYGDPADDDTEEEEPGASGGTEEGPLDDPEDTPPKAPDSDEPGTEE